MEPIGFKDSVTVLFELATVPGLLLLMSPDLGGVRLPSARLGTQGAGVPLGLRLPALRAGADARRRVPPRRRPGRPPARRRRRALATARRRGPDAHGRRRRARPRRAAATSEHGHGKGASGGAKAGHGEKGHSHEGSGGGNAELAQADTEAPSGDHATAARAAVRAARLGGSGGVGLGRRRRPAGTSTAAAAAPRARRHGRAQEPEQGEAAASATTAATTTARATRATTTGKDGKGKGDGHEHAGDGKDKGDGGTTTAAAGRRRHDGGGRRTAAATRRRAAATAAAEAATPSPTAAIRPRPGSSPSASARSSRRRPGTRETIKLQYGPFTLAPGADASWPQVDVGGAEGYMVSAQPSIRFADGTEVGHNDGVHLHHAHLFRRDQDAAGETDGRTGYQWIFGTGDEQTLGSFEALSKGDPSKQALRREAQPRADAHGLDADEHDRPGEGRVPRVQVRVHPRQPRRGREGHRRADPPAAAGALRRDLQRAEDRRLLRLAARRQAGARGRARQQRGRPRAVHDRRPGADRLGEARRGPHLDRARPTASWWAPPATATRG